MWWRKAEVQVDGFVGVEGETHSGGNTKAPMFEEAGGKSAGAWVVGGMEMDPEEVCSLARLKKGKCVDWQKH